MGNVVTRAESLRLKMDNVHTQTAEVQRSTEDECLRYYKPLEAMNASSVEQLRELQLINPETSEPRLLRQKTVA
jgi:hypothetical protein